MSVSESQDFLYFTNHQSVCLFANLIGCLIVLPTKAYQKYPNKHTYIKGVGSAIFFVTFPYF